MNRSAISTNWTDTFQHRLLHSSAPTLKRRGSLLIHSLLEQLVASDDLRVFAVLNFHPTRAFTLYVPAALPLGNDFLQITLAGEAEQVFAAPLYF